MQCFIQCLVQKEDPKQWPETLSRPTCNRMPQRGSENLSELFEYAAPPAMGCSGGWSGRVWIGPE